MQGKHLSATDMSQGCGILHSVWNFAPLDKPAFAGGSRRRALWARAGRPSTARRMRGL